MNYLPPASRRGLLPGSTELSTQECSYDMQMNHYRDKIESSSDMKLVGIYGDRDKSGLKAGSRQGCSSCWQIARQERSI